jgi:hypothetical protein
MKTTVSIIAVILLTMVLSFAAQASVEPELNQPMGGPYKTTPKNLPVIKLPSDLAMGASKTTGNPHGTPPGQDKEPPEEDPPLAANKWAVVIGISKYKAGGSLWNPANDAQEMKQALMNNYGFSEDNIKLLTDRKATARAIASAIDWLIENEDAESTVVFFFSGHGYRALDGDNWDADTEIDGYDELIVTYDNYGISDGWLKDRFSSLDSQKVTLAFGSCHSGGMFDDSNDDLIAPGRVIVSACQADEYAWDYLLLQNTLWGYYFVDEGFLQGLADLDEDNASIEEAHDYAYEGVTIERSIEDDSHPQINDQYGGELIP